MNANKDVVDLFDYSTHITIPCPTMRVGALIPEARNPHYLGPGKVAEETILTAEIRSRAKGTDRHLVTSSITAGYRIAVSQNNANVSPGTIVCHICEFSIE